MNPFIQSARYALRGLLRNPGFAILAAGTLALGIGANAAVFSVANALLLRPFPFPRIDRLVSIYERPAENGGAVASHDGGEHRTLVTRADFEDLQNDRTGWAALASCGYGDLRLSGGGNPEHIAGSPVSAQFFTVLGASPQLGRTFSAGEFVRGRDQEAVLSDGFWRRRFAGQANVIGSTVLLDDRRFTVIGVMPPGFAYPPGGVDVWTPDTPSEAERGDRLVPALLVVGRLGGSATLGSARARLAAIENRLRRDFPATFASRRFLALPLREAQTGVMKPFIAVFAAASLFVLLIACVNVASLLLARGTRRQLELAVRSALGASRARLVMILFAEWTALSCAAGLAALGIAQTAIRMIRIGLPESIAKWIPGWNAIRLETPVLVFTLAVAVIAGLLFSTIPALRLRPESLSEKLTGAGRIAADRGRSKAQTVLVVSQVALALVLLVGAALLLKGFRRLVGIYRDFDPDGVITLRIHLSEEANPRGFQQAEFFDRVLREFRAIPGVRAASLTRMVPADLGPLPARGLEVEGRPAASPSDRTLVDEQAISSGYFGALRIGLPSGRDFREGDAAGAPGVAIVSEALARRLWPESDPIGRRVRLSDSGPAGPWLTVVGVAADVKQYWFDRAPRLTLYRPFTQAPRPGMFAVLRTGGDPRALLDPARRAVWKIDPAQPIDEIRTMNGVVLESTAMIRIAAGLLLATGSLALALSTIGVGGLVAYSVSQRTQEIGVRIALGARSADVVRLVLRQGLRLSLFGLAVGLPLTLALARLMGGLLYGMVSPDAETVGFVAALLAAVALASAYLPARRAARIDPISALREE